MIRRRVRDLVASLSPRTDRSLVDPRAHLDDDLGFDSLSKIELAVALEQMFALNAITEEQVMGIQTVGDIEQLVISTLERQAG
jgi:acyl carrier protein